MNDPQDKCQVSREAGWFSVASPDAAISHDSAMRVDDRFEAVAAYRPASRAAVEEKRRRRTARPVGMTAVHPAAAPHVPAATTHEPAAATTVSPG